jgi:hypothetical protein
MKNRDPEKADRERKVFDLFLQRTKYPVRPDSIKYDAPEFPCTLENGEAATFETAPWLPGLRRGDINGLAEKQKWRLARRAPFLISL